jgi:hypothetical protein
LQSVHDSAPEALRNRILFYGPRRDFPSARKAPIVGDHPAFIFAMEFVFAQEDKAMRKYFAAPFPFAMMLLLTVVDTGQIRPEPGRGNPQLRTVNDQAGIMKCAKGKHYNTRTRTCDPD